MPRAESLGRRGVRSFLSWWVRGAHQETHTENDSERVVQIAVDA